MLCQLQKTKGRFKKNVYSLLVSISYVIIVVLMHFAVLLSEATAPSSAQDPTGLGHPGRRGPGAALSQGELAAGVVVFVEEPGARHSWTALGPPGTPGPFSHS